MPRRCPHCGQVIHELSHLPIEPFAAWLRTMIAEIGLTNVASAVGDSASTVSRKHLQRFVTVQTVDKYTMALGYNLLDIYPGYYE